jgi:hypothetical protein
MAVFNVGQRVADDLRRQTPDLDAGILPKAILSHCSESERNSREMGQLPAPVVAAPCHG